MSARECSALRGPEKQRIPEARQNRVATSPRSSGRHDTIDSSARGTHDRHTKRMRAVWRPEANPPRSRTKQRHLLRERLQCISECRLLARAGRRGCGPSERLADGCAVWTNGRNALESAPWGRRTKMLRLVVCPHVASLGLF